MISPILQSEAAMQVLTPSSQVKVPATCGELMQGYLDGQAFLINSPISRFAHFEVEKVQTKGVYIESQENFSKVKKAVQQALSQGGVSLSDVGFRIRVHEAIPRGKGLASSTAEMTAAMSATYLATSGSYWDEVAFPKVLLDIDHSSDAVYCQGITMCAHLSGKILKQFYRVPSLAFIVVDAGGEVDTASFDRQRARANAQRHEDRLRHALDLMISGFEKMIPSLIAQAATESAYINQEILAKECLEELIEGTKDWGALGLNCAHTGSVLGVMFDPRTSSSERLYERVASLVGGERILGTYKLVSGGMY